MRHTFLSALMLLLLIAAYWAATVVVVAMTAPESQTQEVAWSH